MWLYGTETHYSLCFLSPIRTQPVFAHSPSWINCSCTDFSHVPPLLITEVKWPKSSSRNPLVSHTSSWLSRITQRCLRWDDTYFSNWDLNLDGIFLIGDRLFMSEKLSVDTKGARLDTTALVEGWTGAVPGLTSITWSFVSTQWVLLTLQMSFLFIISSIYGQIP